jgi:excisionase family DNA binding protein
MIERLVPVQSQTELITITDIAQLLRVNQRTIERMQSAGELPTPICVGRLRKWRLCDILAWLQGQKRAVHTA